VNQLAISLGSKNCFHLFQFVVLRFMVPDEDDPGNMKEILEIGRREWLSLGEDSQISCAWPPNHDDPTKLKALVTKKTVPDDTWILHECDIMSAYCKLTLPLSLWFA